MEDAVRNTAASNQDDTACLKRTRTRWKTRLVSFFEKEKKNEFEAEESFFFSQFCLYHNPAEWPPGGAFTRMVERLSELSAGSNQIIEDIDVISRCWDVIVNVPENAYN